MLSSLSTHRTRRGAGFHAVNSVLPLTPSWTPAHLSKVAPPVPPASATGGASIPLRAPMVGQDVCVSIFLLAFASADTHTAMVERPVQVWLMWCAKWQTGAPSLPLVCCGALISRSVPAGVCEVLLSPKFEKETSAALVVAIRNAYGERTVCVSIWMVPTKLKDTHTPNGRKGGGRMKGDGTEEGAGGVTWGAVGGKGMGHAGAQITHQGTQPLPRALVHLPSHALGTHAISFITTTTHTAVSSPFSSSLCVCVCAGPGPIPWCRPGGGPGGVRRGV